MKTAKNRRTGIAIMLVLVVVVIGSVLGMTYITGVSVKLAGSANLLRAERARYLAESGLQHALYLLRTGSADLAASSQSNPMGPYYADSTNDSYKLWAEAAGDPLDYWVRATGTTGGLTRESRMRVQLRNSYRDKLLALGPVSYWRLGELSGETALDQRNINPGTYKNGVQLNQPGVITGDLDRAAHFDGLDEYVKLGNIDLPGMAMTLLVWFRADDFAVYDARLICKAKSLDPEDHWWMLSTVYDSGEMRLRYRLKAGGFATVLNASTGALKANEWTMAVATYDGTYMKIYKDGQRVGMRVKTGWINTDSSVVAWLGGNPSGATDRPFHGLVDEAAIFNKCLSQNDLRILYDARMASVTIVSWDK